METLGSMFYRGLGWDSYLKLCDRFPGQEREEEKAAFDGSLGCC